MPSIWSLLAVVAGNVKLVESCVDKGAKPPLKEVTGSVESTGSAGNAGNSGSAAGAVLAGVSVATGVIWVIGDEDVAGASDGACDAAGGLSWRSSVGT